MAERLLNSGGVARLLDSGTSPATKAIWRIVENLCYVCRGDGINRASFAKCLNCGGTGFAKGFKP